MLNMCLFDINRIEEKQMQATYAPWTKQQVEKLNEYQQCDWAHEFTCGNDHKPPNTLIAREDGWHCPQCAYHQTWAHEFMLHGAPPDPARRHE